MSVYKKQVVVESFPAYDVVERHTPGSVVSYALQYNRCPMKEVADAKEKGHELHWLNQCSVALTSHKQEKKTLVKVEIGMKVCFEGLYATIEAAPNDNLVFKPL